MYKLIRRVYPLLSRSKYDEDLKNIWMLIGNILIASVCFQDNQLFCSSVNDFKLFTVNNVHSTNPVYDI